jgi:predicted DNA-binding transcriptional regulator
MPQYTVTETMSAASSGRLPENAIKILAHIVRRGGSMRYSEIKRELGMPDGTLNHNLNRLIGEVLLEKVGDTGLYRLPSQTPWLFFSENRERLRESFVYVGLLGKMRDEVEEPVYRTAISLLSKEPDPSTDPRSWGLGVRPKYVYIMTGEEAKSSWTGLQDVDSWILLSEDELWDIDRVEEKLLKMIEPLMRDHAIILDSTGDGKPPALAFYEVANKKLIPLIYIHRTPNARRLRWLISPDDILRKLGLYEWLRRRRQ